jgi:hypothetical protein
MRHPGFMWQLPILIRVDHLKTRACSPIEARLAEE